MQLFDKLDPAVEAALRSSIQRFGVIVPIVRSAGPWNPGEILDGNHRWMISQDLGVHCPELAPWPCEGEEEAAEVSRTLNLDRRHMDPEHRRDVVADLRSQGFSLRAIAGAVGTSQTQVARDLEASAVTDVTPPEVLGQDGKRYPARRQVHPEIGEEESAAIVETLEEEWGEEVPEEELAQAIEENLESKRVPRPPSKPDLGGGISHPARYSDALLPRIAELLTGYKLVLDPFAGTGRIHELPNRTIGVEIEPEWASLHPDTVVGDALALPFGDETFDAICTSPTYGNRLADHHNAADPETRRSYTHDLGRQLHSNNSGALHWGDEYRQFHETAWAEAIRVLKPGGRFVLNIKDHIRHGEVQLVTTWHAICLVELGLSYLADESTTIATPSFRAGSNAEVRIGWESILVFEK